MFCRVKGLEEWGLAKVIDPDPQSFTVEYFDSPAQRKTLKVDSSKVIPTTLGKNVRVYLQDAISSTWAVGRVQYDDGESLEVRRQGSRDDVIAQYENVYVRWKKPIVDPVDFLSHGITETPRYSDARNGFRDSYLLQRRVTGGISALLSSAIELNPHQIDVIRRVVSDPEQRYLLADEVGLGKTIEAGVIIRQAVLDDPKTHRIVVVVPESLVNQWRNELEIRFGLAGYLDDSVFVFPHRASPELTEELLQANLLVIDEAHHVTVGSARLTSLYEVLQQAALRSPRILLLSATPALRNETGFLRMLHLLDPLAYRLDDEQGFRDKVGNRQFLAEAVASIDPTNILQLRPVLEELERLLPSDGRLRELTSAVRGKLAGRIDANDLLTDALRSLRTHLSETYRLHRRILRNRRKRITGLTPMRQGARLIVISDPTRQALEGELENWRINAIASLEGRPVRSTGEIADFYWHAIELLLGGCSDLSEHLEKRREQVAGGEVTQSFTDEVPLLDRMASLAHCHAELVGKTVEALTVPIKALLERGVKVVVFCSVVDQADAVHGMLIRALKPARVYRHQADATGADNWKSFLDGQKASVLVCDQSAEEGVNLQGGRKAVVHFDLPLAPNRIEQRLGRVDRYGAGDPIVSLVPIVDTPMQHAWFEILSSGFQIFDGPVSSLQYLIEEQRQLLRTRAFMEGVDAMHDLATALRGSGGLVARESRLIDEQDALDELEPTPDDAIEEILDADADWKSISAATDNWAIGTLMFEAVRESSDGMVSPPFRFRYHPPTIGRSTLIPLSGFLEEFTGALEYDAPGASARRLLTHLYSYRRQTAITQHIKPLRYGSEFLAALKSFSDADDRGRSCARWRCWPSGLPFTGHRLYFQFNFVVEGDAKAAIAKVSEPQATLVDGREAAVGRRLDALFPPLVLTAWLDEDGMAVDQAFVDSYLSNSTTADVEVIDWIDTNLKASRLSQAIRALPDVFGSWRERCLRLRDQALVLLKKSEGLLQSIEVGVSRAIAEKEFRQARLETRITYVEGEEAVAERGALLRERDLSEAIIEAIRHPRITLDVVGVLVLSDQPYPIAEVAVVAPDGI